MNLWTFFVTYEIAECLFQPVNDSKEEEKKKLSKNDSDNKLLKENYCVRLRCFCSANESTNDN